MVPKWSILICVLLALLASPSLSEMRAAPETRPLKPANFRFPQRLKIINNEGSSNGASSNNNNGMIHYPNPMIQGNFYGPPPAGGSVECICPCTKEYLPICGSDARTYGNNCLFQCQRKCKPGLQFKSCGTCEEPIEELRLPCF